MSELVVYGSRSAWGAPDFSPFVIKLETWLRLAGIPYQRRDGGNPLRAPKGKIPYVELDGRLLGDSQLILEELTRRHDIQLDTGLTPEQRATARAVRRMVEEGLYFVTLRLRWVEDDGYAVLYPAFSKLFPAPIAPVAMALVRRNVRRSAQAQGAGRHSREEVLAMGIADLFSVETLLGNQPYLLGDVPRSIDATLYAFLTAIQTMPVDTPVHAAARSPRLTAYTTRIRERYWPPTEVAPR